MYLRVFLSILLISLFIGEAGADQHESSLTIQTTLPNGLQVVIQPVPWTKLIRVESFFSAGSATEPDSLQGLAHLAEHLLTESSRNYPNGELKRRFSLFSTGFNAYTSSSVMAFKSSCLPEFLPDILDLEADRLSGSALDSIAFQREKSVVQEELAYRYRQGVYYEFYDEVFAASYPGHAFGRPVIGSHESLDRIVQGNLVDFIETKIVPSRCVLVIQGAVDSEIVLQLVKEKFTFGTPAEPVVPAYSKYPPIQGGQVILDSSRHDGVDVSFGCRVPLIDEKTAAITRALDAFFEEANVGVVTYFVPGECEVFLWGGKDYLRAPKDPQQNWGYPDFDPEQDALRLMGFMWENLDKALEELRKKEVFEEAKERALKGINSQNYESIEGSAIGKSLVNGNTSLNATTYEQIINNLTWNDLIDYASKYLVPGRAVVGVSHGRDSGRQSTLDIVKRVKPDYLSETPDPLALLGSEQINPVLEVYRKSHLFQFEKIELASGMPVHCLVLPESDQWHFMGLRTFKYIKDLRPGKKPGLNLFYNRVVNFDDQQRYDPERPAPSRRLPWNIKLSLLPYSFEFSADGPKNQASDVVAAVTRRFKSRDFNKRKWSYFLRRGNSVLQGFCDNPGYQSWSWGWARLFPEDSSKPYYQLPEPSVADEMKYKDLQKLHNNVTKKVGNTQLVSAGPFTGKEVGELLQKGLGLRGDYRPETWNELSSSDETQNEGKVFPALDQGDLVLTLSFGPFELEKLGPNSGTKLELYSTTLDQCLTSRLRHKEGLTYTLSCHAIPVQGAYVWQVSITCQPAQGPRVLESLVDELRTFGESGFDEDEWSRGRLKYTGKCINFFSDPQDGASFLRRLTKLGSEVVDPMMALFLVEKKELDELAAQTLNMDRLVFSIKGPLFEEDLDQYDHFLTDTKPK